MSGYLETYGAGVDRRNRIIKWAVLAIVASALLAVVLYFAFRFHSEENRVEAFLDAVRAGDYQRAYTLWGCTPESPCRDYSFEKFQEDWGPNGQFAPMAAGEVNYIEPCGEGLIFTVELAGHEPLVLWLGKSDPTLGFAPWPLCPQKGVEGISLRKVRLFIQRLLGNA